VTRDLLAVAQSVAAIIGPDECVLVGGLAVGAHGYVRGTDDVDILTRLSLKEVARRLQEHGIEAELRIAGERLEGDFDIVRAWQDGVRIDVLPPLAEIHWERAVELRIPGRLRLVSLEDLLALKFRAGGPRDLMDAAALVLRHPDVTARARELAARHRLTDKFDVWLQDPRLMKDIAETSAAEDKRRDATRARKRRGRSPRRSR
jgi:hypothetical protein